MPSATEGIRTAEFIRREPFGEWLRETVTILEGENLSAGTVLGKVTASGKYAAYKNNAADGRQTAAGILYRDVNATDGDREGLIINKETVVVSYSLFWDSANNAAAITAGIADLELKRVWVRTK